MPPVERTPADIDPTAQADADGYRGRGALKPTRTSTRALPTPPPVQGRGRDRASTAGRTSACDRGRTGDTSTRGVYITSAGCRSRPVLAPLLPMSHTEPRPEHHACPQQYL
jgi:hypothetical protein